jgi:hypothetical protein
MILEVIFIFLFLYVISYIFVWEKFADYIFLRECKKYSNNLDFYEIMNPKITNTFQYQVDTRFNVARINPVF